MLAKEAAPAGIKRVRKEPEEDKQVAKDFFGRPIVPKKGSTKPVSSRKPPIKRAPVIYKFNEGNSSAVRKPIKVSAFL